MEQETDEESAGAEEGAAVETVAQEVRELYPTFTAGAEMADKQEVPWRMESELLQPLRERKTLHLFRKSEKQLQ